MDGFICQRCNKLYHLNDVRWRCDCGSILDIAYRAQLSVEKMKQRKPTMWRYRESLPLLDDENIITFDEGYTPLIPIDINKQKLYVKLEYLFPTGSYKDRGASLLMSKVKENGINEVVEDSSGNAGCSIAAYSALGGIKAHIYVPENTSVGKTTQITMYGATLNKVPGSRQDTSNAIQKQTEHYYYASHVWNPYFLHGVKTFAYEVWEQLDYSAPDTVIIPTGNGTLFIGAYIGFRELLEQKLITTMPKLIAVQPENCAPIYEMYKHNLSECPDIQAKETISEGTAIEKPVRGKQVLNIVKETGGDIYTVSEEEIKEAVTDLCQKGIFVEPTAATGIAASKKYQSFKGEVIVVPLTGHGLKSVGKK